MIARTALIAALRAGEQAPAAPDVNLYRCEHGLYPEGECPSCGAPG